MELIDRYLHAVKFWLPSKQKDDIIAELSEDIRSQIEDAEAELGHKLSDAEVEPILKRCGSPMAVTRTCTVPPGVGGMPRWLRRPVCCAGLF